MSSIGPAKVAAIRRNERRKIRADVQQLLNDRMGTLSSCEPTSTQRPVLQGAVVALTDVLILLEKGKVI